MFNNLIFCLLFVWGSSDRSGALIPTPISNSSFTPRIVGGRDATAYQFPFMVMIITPKQTLCGGTLIAPNLVLTAAHCCVCGDNGVTSQFKLYVNLYRSDLTDQCTDIRTPVDRRCHPDYVPGRPDHDFCLLTLDRPSSYPPALVYDSSKVDDFDSSYAYDGENANVLVIGFGLTNSTLQTVPAVLQKVLLPIANVDTCRDLYEGIITFDPNFVLCGNTSANPSKPVDSCLGDSGGPMFNRLNNGSYLLVGVVSTGPSQCATVGYPGVYAKINTPSFLNFLYGPPTPALTSFPTQPPTQQPTRAPTKVPTLRPTFVPTSRPSLNPTSTPTIKPSRTPTQQPTARPSTTRPTRRPSLQPTSRPTKNPTFQPTRFPTKFPTIKGATKNPTPKPTTKLPTERPTRFPTRTPTTRVPSEMPTRRPSRAPTAKPSRAPTNTPTTRTPTNAPTRRPTVSPTTRSPTLEPTTRAPTLRPTTRAPTPKPTTLAPTHTANCVNTQAPAW